MQVLLKLQQPTMMICRFRKEKNMDEREILCLAIRKFGDRAQEEVAIEECSELIQAITHKHRGREHNLVEEIADVEIMLEQLKIINCCHKEVEDLRKSKVTRLFHRMFEIERVV